MSAEHPTVEEMLGYLVEEGTVPESIRAHTATCRACAESWNVAERLVAAARVALAVEPSDTLIERTWRHIERARALDPAARAIAHAGDALRGIVAVLVGDTARPSHAVRGATTALPRVLVYETDAVGISLSIEEHGERAIAVKGQIMPRHEPSLPDGGRAIVAADEACVEVPLGAFGEFDAGVVPRATLHVVVVIGSTRVELPAVSIGGKP